MAAALVQAEFAANEAGGSLTISKAFTSAQTAGHVNVIIPQSLASVTGQSVSSVTDAVAISGTVSVTNGLSTIAFTASVSLAKGTKLAFSSQAGVQYTLASAIIAGTAGTLTTSYTGTTNAAATATFGNTYTKALAATLVEFSGNWFSGEIWYATVLNASGAGANTVSVAYTGVTAGQVEYTNLLIHELSGAPNFFNASSGNASGGSSTTMTSGTVTSSGPSTLILAAFLIGDAWSAPGTGYTLAVENTTDDGAASEYRVVSTTGSFSPTATQGAVDVWQGVSATFGTLIKDVIFANMNE